MLRKSELEIAVSCEKRSKSARAELVCGGHGSGEREPGCQRRFDVAAPELSDLERRIHNVLATSDRAEARNTLVIPLASLVII